MTRLDRQKWDQRYTEGAYLHRRHPSDWLRRALEMAGIESGRGRRALDLACGRGRNALYLAQLGFEVDAMDISPVGLAQAAASGHEQGLKVNWLEADLDLAFHPPGVYDLIVMIRYVNLPLLQELRAHLRPGGWLVCEEHLQTEEDVRGPQSEAFRLVPGALATACEGLQIHYLEEGIFEDPDGERVALARVLAQRMP